MTNEELYLREKIGTDNPFRVPEGYFGQFATQVMQQLPERRQSKARLAVLRPWLYAAASLVTVAIMGAAFYFSDAQSADEHQLAVTSETSYMDEAADYAMLDNAEIYACLSDN